MCVQGIDGGKAPDGRNREGSLREKEWVVCGGFRLDAFTGSEELAWFFGRAFVFLGVVGGAPSVERRELGGGERGPW